MCMQQIRLVSTDEPQEQLGWLKQYPEDAFFQQHVYVSWSSQPAPFTASFKCFHDLQETYLATIHKPLVCRNGPCKEGSFERDEGELFHYKRITCPQVSHESLLALLLLNVSFLHFINSAIGVEPVPKPRREALRDAHQLEFKGPRRDEQVVR